MMINSSNLVEDRICKYIGCKHNINKRCMMSWTNDDLEDILKYKYFSCSYAEPNDPYVCLCGSKLLIEKEWHEIHGKLVAEEIPVGCINSSCDVDI